MMRKKAAYAGLAIGAALLALVFLSRTIYTQGIPTVTAANMSIGKLQKSEKSRGVVDWAETAELYAPISGKVSEVLVKEGDEVTAGQEIARLTFDETAVKEQLSALDADLVRLEINKEATNRKLTRAQESLSALYAEAYETDAPTDRDVRTAESKLSAARTDAAEKEILYASGNLTRKEYETAVTAVTEAENTLTEAKTAYEKSLLDAADALAKKESDRASQVKSLLDEIESHKQDLRSKELDRAENDYKRAKYEHELASFAESRSLYAEVDGTVLTLNLERGRMVNEDELAGTFGVKGSYVLTCELPIENNFVTAGDECTIANANHSFRVQASRLTVEDGKKKVSIYLSQDSIQVGETFDVTFRKDSADSHTLVPNAAVYEDSDGAFVYVVRERKGILGDEYYVRKQSIQVGDSDGANSVVTRGASLFDPIVTLSDKPFDDNAAVKLRNEGDFIVD